MKPSLYYLTQFLILSRNRFCLYDISLIWRLLLKLFQLVAHLWKRVLCGIGFLSAFLSGTEIGFFQSAFYILTAIFHVVHNICAPMLLAEVAMLLKANFLWDSGRRLSTRPLGSFLALVGSFLVGWWIGLFLCTYALYSLERHEKQTHVHGSHTFLVKVEMVVPRKWAHPKNVTCQISLSEWYFHRNCTGLGTGAVDTAW